VHFEQGIPCLLFEEFFTDAASWLGILRQRQEHGNQRRFSGAYLHCGRSGQRRHHVHLRSGRHRISNTADGVRRESQYQWISLLLVKQKEKALGPRESSRLPAAEAGKSKQGEAAPGATERTDYFQMPGYSYDDYDGVFAWFSFKEPCIRLHLRPPVIQDHKEELAGCATTKAIVSFPADRAISIALVKKLVQASLRVMKAPK